MASENLINDLFELVQLNTKEKLSYDDFEKDLLKNLNLPNDEIDRALSFMRAQAEINASIIGEVRGGKFIFSPKFNTVVISTIKYENQFIPGKEEYIVRESNTKLKDELVSYAIITPTLISQMLNNFENLSGQEVADLAAQFHKMSDEDKERFIEAEKIYIQKNKEFVKSYYGNKEVEMVEDISNIFNEIFYKIHNGEMTHEDMGMLKKSILMCPKFIKEYYKETGVIIDEKTVITEEMMYLFIGHGRKANMEHLYLVSFREKVNTALENGNIEELITIINSNPALGEKYLAEIESIALSKGLTIEEILGVDNEIITVIQKVKNETEKKYFKDRTQQNDENSGIENTISINQEKKGSIERIVRQVTDENNETISNDKKNIHSFYKDFLRYFSFLRESDRQSWSQKVSKKNKENIEVIKSIIGDVTEKYKERQSEEISEISTVVGYYKLFRKGIKSEELTHTVNDKFNSYTEGMQKVHTENKLEVESEVISKVESKESIVEEDVFGSFFDMFDIESGDNESVLEQNETQIKETIQKQQEIKKTREELYKSGLETDDIDYAKITDQEFEKSQTMEVEHMEVDPTVVFFKEGYSKTIAIDDNNKTIESIISDSIDADDSSNSGDSSKKTLGIGNLTLLVSSARSGSIMDAQQELVALTELEKKQDKGKEDIEEDTQIQE